MTIGWLFLADCFKASSPSPLVNGVLHGLNTTKSQDTHETYNQKSALFSQVAIKGVPTNDFLSGEINHTRLKRNNSFALMHYNSCEWKPTNALERLEER